MFHTSGFLKKGFTLVELIVVTSIVLLLSSIFLANYRAGGKEYSLLRAANKLAQDIRRAGEMAISTRECKPPPTSCPAAGGVPTGGYGFYIDKSQDDRYFIYADSGTSPNPEKYTSGEEIETIFLETGVYIKDLQPTSANFSINFKPPDPTINIKDATGQNKDNMTITIALRTDPTKTKLIKVNKVGLIDID